MTEDPRTPEDDETPDATGDVAEPEQSADPSESPAEEAPVETDAAASSDPGDGGVDTPAGDTTTADEPGGPTAEGVNAPDEPALAPDVIGPEGAEEAGSGAEAGAQAAGLDTGPAAELDESRERPKPSAKKQARRDQDGGDSGDASSGSDAVPGAHLEPDLVLEPSAQEAQDEYGAYAQTYDTGTNPDDGSVDARPAEPSSASDADGEPGTAQPVERKPLDLAADARYPATGKRKTAIARVILKPGTGTYTVNGRPLDAFFPRLGLQRTARGPLETAGYESRMDVVARIHGGGVSAQAGALRHGIARALVEADPNLRTELKRQGFLTRDARVKERKKAGLKKARKRPQFSKR